MIFCPVDGAMLSCRAADTSSNLIFACHTCPYMYQLRRGYLDSAATNKSLKARDDVLGGAKEWANAPQGDTTCPKCSHEKAYFKEIQTRSADEPATLFYKCVKCHHDWKEG